MALLKAKTSTVLIPLLLDDPLWASKAIHAALKNNGLNPSFAG